MVGKLVVLAVGAVVVVVALIFIPLPWIGLNYYNVNVQTTISETCIIFCSYSVQSVNPAVTGPSTIIDVPGWLGWGYNIAAPCLDCQYKVTATIGSNAGLSASVSETKFISNLLNFGYTDTLNLAIAYVPGGTYTVSVVVTLNGGTIATGTGSLNVI